MTRTSNETLQSNIKWKIPLQIKNNRNQTRKIIKLCKPVYVVPFKVEQYINCNF